MAIHIIDIDGKDFYAELTSGGSRILFWKSKSDSGQKPLLCPPIDDLRTIITMQDMLNKELDEEAEAD